MEQKNIQEVVPCPPACHRYLLLTSYSRKRVLQHSTRRKCDICALPIRYLSFEMTSARATSDRLVAIELCNYGCNFAPSEFFLQRPSDSLRGHVNDAHGSLSFSIHANFYAHVNQCYHGLVVRAPLQQFCGPRRICNFSGENFSTRRTHISVHSRACACVGLSNLTRHGKEQY